MMLEVIRGEADAAEWQRAVVGDALERGMALQLGARPSNAGRIWRSVIIAAGVAAVVAAVVTSKKRLN